jgi:hypothetical protein
VERPRVPAAEVAELGVGRGARLPAVERAHADALRAEVGKTILNPLKDVPAADREKLAKVVDGLFGTPLAPAVPGAPEELAELGLSPAALARGAGLYRQWCVSCHGPAGAADGPAASTLMPPPRDYRTGCSSSSPAPPTTKALPAGPTSGGPSAGASTGP